METHPPHVHHSSGKKFSHYFYEFLMLFLAVFSGFMAENFREENVEHTREREFMRTLVDDLKTDTANLTVNISFGETMSGRIDTLISLLNEYPTNTNVEELYNINSRSGRVVNIDFEDRTSSQLKNAGNMRLIRNSSVSDSIRNYWSTIKVLESISSRLEDLRNKAQDISIQIFHNKFILNINKLDPVHSKTSIVPGAKLINNKPELIAQYSNRRYNNSNVLKNYLLNMKSTKAQAAKLIKLIMKEYHFE